jgi:hypothetical protein
METGSLSKRHFDDGHPHSRILIDKPIAIWFTRHMQNSFWRLKHYRLASDEAADAKENHATECLAACLRFSPVIRREFIQFLFQDHPIWRLINSHLQKVSISTQQRIDNRYFLDIVLQKEGHFTIVVEVKIGSLEDAAQLKRYTNWLKGQTQQPKRHLFSLVQHHNPQFNPKDHGADAHRTWLDLYRRLNTLLQKPLSATDSTLITQLCGYLENEGIVMPYKIKDLKNFKLAINAAEAISAVFQHVKQTLEKETGFEIKCKPEPKHDSWPSMHIGKSVWRKKFGGGDIKKVNIWFMVPLIWDAQQHGFGFDIDLWNKGHKNGWIGVKPKLKRWLPALTNWQVCQDNWDNAVDNLDPKKIEQPPCRILVPHYSTIGKRLEREKFWSFMSEEKLVSCLVEQARQMISKIDKLPT